MNEWYYRCYVKDFKRHEDGSCSYTFGEVGNIPYKPIKSGLLKLKLWAEARKEAERTGKDITVLVAGKGNSLKV